MTLFRFLMGCFLQLCVMDAYALQISHVYHEPKVIDPVKNELIKVSYTLSEKSNIDLNIYDDRDMLVRRISKSNVAAGNNNIIWNGKDEAGLNVPPEAYRYTLTAVSATKKTEYDLSDITGNRQIHIKKLKWNSDKSQFEYQLKKPARVLIRVGIDNHGPLMGTITNWLPRIAGQHTEHWNGFDASQVINLAKHPKLESTVQAYSLSDNTIFVGPETNSVKFIENMSWPEEKRKIKNTRKKVITAAYQQSPQTRGDYELKLSFPETQGLTKEGVPILKGKVPVLLDVPDTKRKIALSRRAESVLYIDGQFSIENEVGFIPMTWIVDVDKMHKGEHYLSVNLRGYEGNFGVATVKIYVQK